MFTRKIGIDLGTANTVVFVPGRGFIINEPTIVALRKPAPLPLPASCLELGNARPESGDLLLGQNGDCVHG